ncbi:hypothetical protein PENSPDRAFT_658930 [Peniophora sp. CONT]|nr:hypothetical protein PENSPDRAFT_658930 [Peniophora sp. CONT]
MSEKRLASSSGPLSRSSSLAIAYSPDEEGEQFWSAYEEAVEKEGNKMGDYASTTMNGTLTFAGLFGALIGAFCIKSVEMLSPDSGSQAVDLHVQAVALLTLIASGAVGNGTLLHDARYMQPFRDRASSRATAYDSYDSLLERATPDFEASESAVLINLLWFVGLIVALACALLATMVQEWTRRYLRGQGRRAHENKEQYAVDHMTMRITAEEWGLDRAASLVVGLMHAAVIIFVLGIDVYLYTLHNLVAFVTSVISGNIVCGYVLISCLPLIIAGCPYATPLTDLLHFTAVVPVCVVVCLGTYCLLLVLTIRYRINSGPLTDEHLGLLRPALWVKFLANPVFATRAAGSIWDYFVRRRAGEIVHMLPHIMDKVFNLQSYEALQRDDSEEVDRRTLRGKMSAYVWDRVGSFVLMHPGSMHFFTHYLVNAHDQRAGHLFAGFRTDRRYMESFAATLIWVPSAFAATGALRLLQLLVQGENPYDQYATPEMREERRWPLMDPIIRKFRQFAEQVGSVNEGALANGDTSVIEAVSSFRSTLIILLSRTRTPYVEPNARTRILSLFKDFDRVESLRLKPLAASDADDVEDLLSAHLGRRLYTQLAYRNALTLIAAAKSCGWRGSWHNPDRRYLPKNTSGTLHWYGPSVDVLRRYTKPAASAFFLSFLSDVGLDHWKEPGSDLRAPPDSPLPRAAVEALRDLALAVDLQERTLPIAAGDRGVSLLTPLVTPNAYDERGAGSSDAPSSPTLGSAEEGKVETERRLRERAGE